MSHEVETQVPRRLHERAVWEATRPLLIWILILVLLMPIAFFAGIAAGTKIANGACKIDREQMMANGYAPNEDASQ